MKDDRYFLRTFYLSLSSLLLCGIIICIYANPWRSYGSGALSGFYNGRLAKSEYLSVLDGASLPNVYIFGSSTSMSYPIEPLNRVKGYRAFNFSDFWSTTDDYISEYRYLYYKLKVTSSLIVVGLDTFGFSPPEDTTRVLPTVSRRLLASPLLKVFHPDYSITKDIWLKATDLFSEEQLVSSLMLIQRGERRTSQSALGVGKQFNLDGTRRSYPNSFGSSPEDILPLVDSGKFSINSYLDSGRSEYLRINNFNFNHLDPKRISHLKVLSLEATQAGTRLLFILNPVHPKLLEALYKHTPHKQNLDELRSLLSELQRTYPKFIRWYDGTEINDFGGSSEYFYDAVHPAKPNSELLLNAALNVTVIK